MSRIHILNKNTKVICITLAHIVNLFAYANISFSDTKSQEEMKRTIEIVEELYQNNKFHFMKKFNIEKQKLESVINRYISILKSSIQSIDGKKVSKYEEQRMSKTEAMLLSLTNKVLDLFHKTFSNEEMRLISEFYITRFDGLILAHHLRKRYISMREAEIIRTINEQIKQSM